MKIGIIGASGKAGRLILQEAKTRDHEVTAIVRDKSKVEREDVAIIEKDVFSLTKEDVQDFDVIVNAFGAPLGEEQAHVDAGNHLIEILSESETRLLVVGGAGSLYTDESKTTRVLDTPDFPDMFKPTATGQTRNLEALQNTEQLNWTFISPAGFFDAEGKRTGQYQKGKDVLTLNSKGESYISYADFAIAVVDEIEKQEHVKERFSVVAEKAE